MIHLIHVIHVLFSVTPDDHDDEHDEMETWIENPSFTAIADVSMPGADHDPMVTVPPPRQQQHDPVRSRHKHNVKEALCSEVVPSASDGDYISTKSEKDCSSPVMRLISTNCLPLQELPGTKRSPELLSHKIRVCRKRKHSPCSPAKEECEEKENLAQPGSCLNSEALRQIASSPFATMDDSDQSDTDSSLLPLPSKKFQFQEEEGAKPQSPSLSSCSFFGSDSQHLNFECKTQTEMDSLDLLDSGLFKDSYPEMHTEHSGAVLARDAASRFADDLQMAYAEKYLKSSMDEFCTNSDEEGTFRYSDSQLF